MLRSLLVISLLCGVAAADTRSTVKVPKPPTAISVTVDYQRVGRDLLRLQDQRGKFDCGDLATRFRAIKLDQAVVTPASRIAAATELAEIATKIDRLRGIKVAADCLHNPLADGCK